MQRKQAVCAVAVLALSGFLLAQTQTPASGPAGEVQGSYARVKANILKAAENMPAENYSFKPTPDIRTFARVVNHVTEAQLHSCGAVNHLDPKDAPKVPEETADKAAIVAALNASFAECDKAYAALTNDNVAESFQVGQAKRSRIGLMWGTVAHDTEQYATLALYMRLKGLVPPSSEK
jgi:uncharacterized damage-inducible protein DinB